MKFSRTRIAVFVGILALLGGVALGGIAYVRTPRLTPELRGAQLAANLGCFACHGPRGTGGVPNPGSDEEEVPAWDGGNVMMYVKNEQEIREWILYGHPKRLEKEHDHGSSDDLEDHGDQGQHGSSEDPEAHGDQGHVEGEGDSPLLRMPAFEHVVSEKELEDLVAYYKAVASFETLPPDARQGYRVASRLGCFGCHGPGGRVGSRNPRSFKGYIPPWRGRDFAELVKSDEELRQWILDGTIDRLESNPFARHFTGRQVIQMPAYRDVLVDGEVDALVAYIHWLQNQGP
jgi:mono/diheme cytochrome c family protein